MVHAKQAEQRCVQLESIIIIKLFFFIAGMHKHLPLALILCAFALFSGSIALTNDEVWWDSAVYLGMGKYVWSYGESGLMEPSRPLILPFILGFFWKIGVNELIAAKVIAVLFSVGTIIVTYSLGKKLHDGNTGILAALFMALSHTFLLFSSLPLTEIPSTFFLLTGILLFFDKKYFPSGMLLGLAFVSRFFQAFFIAFFLIALFFLIKSRKHVFSMLKGLSVVVVPYFMLAWILFGNPLTPLLIQFYLSMNTGVIYSQPLLFYVHSIIKENFFVLALLALPFMRITKEMRLLAISTLLTFITYSLFSHKEMRLLLVVLPLILMITAYCAVSLYNLSSRWNKEISKAFSISLISFLLVLSFAASMGLLKTNNPVNSQEKLFQAHMIAHQDKDYWISSPTYALFSNAKVSGLMYYPLISGMPNTALVSSCDFLGNNDEYLAKTAKHVKIIESTMENVYTAEENGCMYRIFERATSLS
jgi:4-amino-4-deoxy-L-arabinose transferase-like glycosyltransferase